MAYANFRCCYACLSSPLRLFSLQIQYKMDPVQMKFLRLLSMRITQTITYHCYNSRAWEEDDDRTIKLQGENDMELTTSEKTKPKVITNSCDVSQLFKHLLLCVTSLVIITKIKLS